MSILVLIDGNAMLHRAYHAMPKNLTDKKGNPINAVYGFTSMLMGLIEDLSPTNIAVCFDRKEPTFRKKIYKSYQSKRPEMDKELAGQFEPIKKIIKSFGIPVYDRAGYEADDLIGTIANQSEKDMDKVVIVTGDRDILQLVTDKINVYLPIKGIANAKMMGKEEVLLKMGVWPEQIIDYKALVGDPSDNYPGISGIGPKNAEELIDKYNSYPEIFNHVDDIPERTRAKLITGKVSGDLSYELAKILTNVPINFSIKDTKGWDINRQEILDAFEGIGFRSLTQRLIKMREKNNQKIQMSLV